MWDGFFGALAAAIIGLLWGIGAIWLQDRRVQARNRRRLEAAWADLPRHLARNAERAGQMLEMLKGGRKPSSLHIQKMAIRPDNPILSPELADHATPDRARAMIEFATVTRNFNDDVATFAAEWSAATLQAATQRVEYLSDRMHYMRHLALGGDQRETGGVTLGRARDWTNLLPPDTLLEHVPGSEAPIFSQQPAYRSRTLIERLLGR